MLTKVERTINRFAEIESELSDPEIIKDQGKYLVLNKERSSMLPLYNLSAKYIKVLSDIKDSEQMIKLENDPSFVELAETEYKVLHQEKEKIEKEIEIELLPKDENDNKNVIIEIRAGAGGDESSLFAGELFRMYSRWAEKHKYKVEILDSHESEVGGFKEIIYSVKGLGAYKNLKYESGVHRVQRVPETESNGRIHTSTVTVAVLAEAEEVDIDINPSEIRIDVFRSSGPGGQSVNTTDSAVRITHLPTGLIVSCQDEKSQIKNKDKAMRVLRSRLLQLKIDEETKKRGDQRKDQIGTGDRSEKIRTYNYPQDRVTDHRIAFSANNLPDFMAGNIDKMLNRLASANREESLKNLSL